MFIKNIARMPSGQADRFFFSLLIALVMSLSLNLISSRSPTSVIYFMINDSACFAPSAELGVVLLN